VNEKGYINSGSSDELKFRELYNRYYLRLFNFSMQFTKSRNESEDLIHEVFLKYWEKRHEIKETAVESLLFTITRNLCLNYVKHLKIIQNKNLDLENIRKWEELYRIEFVGNEPYILIENELHEMILKVMNNLPERCREVFQLSRVTGLKNREIAEKMGISAKAVEKHIARAMHEFRTKLPVLIPAAILMLVIAGESAV
jgi:RNA polymerase sigma-70 factor, ECF subfamily